MIVIVTVAALNLGGFAAVVVYHPPSSSDVEGDIISMISKILTEYGTDGLFMLYSGDDAG